MGILENLIAIERAELGYSEGYNNDTKYGQEYGLNFQPWCVMFQWWCAKRANVPFPNTAHCNGVESYAKEHGQWVTSDYKVGDFVIFDYDFNLERDHIGLVISVNNGRVFQTLEGNYADKVAIVDRSSSTTIIGAYRPNYGTSEDTTEPTDTEDEPDTSTTEPSEQDVPTTEEDNKLPVLTTGDIGDAVGALQLLLRFHGYRMAGSFTRAGDPDCEFGPETYASLMNFCGKDHTDDSVWRKLIGTVG